MTTPLLSEPERWSERAGGNAVEDGVGATLRRVQRATEPSELDVARWAQRAMTARPRRAPRLIWSVAIAAAILGGGGGAVVAGRAIWRAVTVGPPPALAPRESAPAHTRARAHASASASASAKTPPPGVLLQPPEPEAIPDIAEPARPAAGISPPPPPVRRVAPAGKLATEPNFEPAPQPAPTPDEAQLLARAFRQLRTVGDAATALAALDERDRRFPSGHLATEAALARAEALLALGRSDDALPVLLAIQDPRAGLTREVRVARAELLARAGRCAEATQDFDELLATVRMDASHERARYGRASCRLAAGETTTAIADLERYLVDFPEGRFTPAVRQALEKLRRP